MAVSPTPVQAIATGGGSISSRERPVSLVVADANWFTTDHLFGEVERDGVSTLLLNCMDYFNALARGVPPWRWRGGGCRRGPALWQRDFVLPSGWMKQFPRLGMRPIARSVEKWMNDDARGSRLWLVMTYPHYLCLRDRLRPEKSVYFNIDDYSQYWPRHASTVMDLERRAARESDLTVCASRLRMEELRAAVPEAADRIRHLPHGAPSWALEPRPWHRPAAPPPEIAHLPRPLLGYVGTLEDRIDWRLMNALAEAMPEASLVIVGKTGRPHREAWHGERARFLARPNVHALGWRAQGQIPSFNRAFDVCLIPYETNHPFNRVCSPTKIMDYMVTGRPVVSTDLPECRLYAHLFHVRSDAASFIEAARGLVATGSDDGRAALRHDWARANTCRRVADRLLDWLGE